VADYKDIKLTVRERVKDLLGRMTLEERIGQMMQLPANVPSNMDKLESMNLGSYLHCTGDMMKDLQVRAEKTRLGIPLIFGIDAIHGHCFDEDGTVFPTQLALSCSWNRNLVKQMGIVTAKEVRATGIQWTFSPVLCVSRDARWGRVDETFGEDPWLIGELASALCDGYQGEGKLDSWDSILACGKHYAGYGEADGGRDAYEADISKRNMLSLFLPPFEKIVRKGCATLMAGYHAVDGEPCSTSAWMLREKAKEEWNLDGFIVTDWDNIGSLHTKQKVAADLKEAAYMAVIAGNDMIMTTPSFYKNALALVKEGRLSESLIDESAARILAVKFKLGLFDGFRHTPENLKTSVLGRQEHRNAALNASRQSLVLLKNNDILPLNANRIKKIALVGPNADDVVAQLGDWSFGSMQAGAANENFHHDQTVTLLTGLKERSRQEGIDFVFIKGADTVDYMFGEMEEARKAAEEADVTIACVGDTLSLSGEFHDRADLDLTGRQQELLDTVKATGTPLCVIFMASKPLTVPWIKNNADAIVCAFNPGAGGGEALTELLFGDFNASGKLTISFPHHVGQIPVHYNRFSGWHSMNDEKMAGDERYIDMPQEPLFAFGEGMSYTYFIYKNLKLPIGKIPENTDFSVSIDVTNAGDREGSDIVQLYINDLYSSVTTPVKELKGFEKISLNTGETKTVTFTLAWNDLSLVNKQLERVVEAGEFEIMIGGSSRDQDLLKGIITV